MIFCLREISFPKRLPILHFIHYLSGVVEMDVMRQSGPPL